MSDTTQPNAAWNWLRGRSDRKEYWTFVAIVVAISVALGLAVRDGSNTWSTGAILVIQIRRFHDLGRTGWLAVALLVVQFVVIVPMIVAPGDAGILPATAISLAAVVALGVIPGQPHENHYGP